MNTVCDPIAGVKGNGAANGSNGDSHQESETKYLSRWRAMEMDTMRSMNHSLLVMNKSNVMQSLHPGFMTKYDKQDYSLLGKTNWCVKFHILVWGLCERQDHWQHNRFRDRGQSQSDNLCGYQSGRDQVRKTTREHLNVFFLPLCLKIQRSH